MNRLLVSLLTLFVLTSCGGGGGSSGSSNELDSQQEFDAGEVLDVEKWGFIDIHDKGGIYLNSFAQFNRSTSDADNIYRDSLVGPRIAFDTCIIEENVADPSDTITYVNLDAGNKVSLLLGETVFHDLPRFQFQESVHYGETAQSEDTQVPNGLRATYTGGEFPVVEGLNAPDIDPLSEFSHCEESGLDPRTTFSWQPGSNSTAYIVISAHAVSDGVSPDRLVNCFVKDDGQFSIPESGLAKLLTTDTLGIYAINRLARNVYNTNQAAIAVRRMSNACID